MFIFASSFVTEKTNMVNLKLKLLARPSTFGVLPAFQHDNLGVLDSPRKYSVMLETATCPKDPPAHSRSLLTPIQ